MRARREVVGAKKLSQRYSFYAYGRTVNFMRLLRLVFSLINLQLTSVPSPLHIRTQFPFSDSANTAYDGYRKSYARRSLGEYQMKASHKATRLKA